MDMVHMLIEKERYMLRCDQHKFTSSSIRDNYRNPYQKKENTFVNETKPTTHDKNQERKYESEKDNFSLPTHLNRILEDCLERGLIKSIQGK